jgi:hypothetical protein
MSAHIEKCNGTFSVLLIDDSSSIFSFCSSNDSVPHSTFSCRKSVDDNSLPNLMTISGSNTSFDTNPPNPLLSIWDNNYPSSVDDDALPEVVSKDMD